MVRYHIVYLEKGCHHFGQNRGRKHFSAYVLGLFGMVAAEGPQAHAVGNGKPAAGGWAYTWAQLPKYEGGKEIVYTVEEVKVPLGYVGRQRQVGPNKVQLINMIPEVPKTGDDGNMGTHMLLMALSMAGLMVALNQYKKRAKTGMK